MTRAGAARRGHIVYTDGAARGNPGPAGAGAVLLGPDGDLVAEAHEFIGEATNNVAEYRALLLGLERALEKGATDVEVRCDSELIVMQMRGGYRVRSASLRPLHERAQVLASRFDRIRFVHVRRECNRAADRLANRAIDRARAASGSR